MTFNLSAVKTVRFKNKAAPCVHVALPAMNESAGLPATIEGLLAQSWPSFVIWVCVNQPDHWWGVPEKQDICRDNAQSLHYLRKLAHPCLHILDHSSPGRGWTGKSFGVGQARRVTMEAIREVATPEDIILSADADTFYPPGYLASVVDSFAAYPNAMALANPYYHKLSGNDTLDRAMLRYEIYMRCYALNMWRIGSPYSFTALGSAMALPLEAYRKTGGITAKKSGEDFYFLQKLRKTGWILTYNNICVNPGTRFSDRVFFGTGPALIKGSQGIWDSYPVYDYTLFDRVKETCDAFPVLYSKDVQTPMDNFLNEQLKGNVFGPLRQNAATREKFVKACHHKIDGLRILQFLKSEQARQAYNDEANLYRFLNRFYPEFVLAHNDFNWKTLDFTSISIDFLNKIRNFLFEKEGYYQKKDADENKRTS